MPVQAAAVAILSLLVKGEWGPCVLWSLFSQLDFTLAAGTLKLRWGREDC